MELLKRYLLQIYFILIFSLIAAFNIATAQIINIDTNPLSVTTVYGEATSLTSTPFIVSGANMSAGITVTPPTAFEVSRDNITFTNTLTVPLGAGGDISPTEIYIRLKSTTNAGSYTEDIILSSLDAADVTVTMPVSTVNRANFSIDVSDTKIYGETLTDYIEVSDGANFSTVNSALKNGEIATALTINYTAGNLATAAVGTYPNAIRASNLRGTFLPDNYAITYVPGNVTVSPAPLLVTADNKSKIIGEPNPVLTVTYTGFLNGDGPLQLTTQPVVETTATQGSDVGV